MTLLRSCLLTCLVALFAISTDAQTSGSDGMIYMNGDDIRAAFTDKTLEGFYAMVRVRSGQQAYDETYHADGRLDYNEGVYVDTGRWWIDHDRLCHEYAQDTQGEEHCFFIYRLDRCYYFFAGQVAMGGLLRRQADFWNNRSIISGESYSCEQAVA